MADELVNRLMQLYGQGGSPDPDQPTRHPDLVNALAQAYATAGTRNRLAGDPAWPTLPPLPDNRPSLSPYDPQAGRPMDWAERSGVGEGAGLAPLRGGAALGELLGQAGARR